MISQRLITHGGLPWLSALCLCLLTAPLGLAQDAPMEWGKIPYEHAMLTDFPADSNATAVVLGDYGVVTFNNGVMETAYHYRVKLLDEAAYDDYGSVRIGYFPERYDIDDLSAQTLVPRPNGGFDRHEVDRGSFFTEKVGEEYEAITFTFPRLQPGAIVEYRYKQRTENIFLIPTWSFQTDQPVLWSEFRAEVPEDMAYTFIRNNVAEFYINESTERIRPGEDVRAYRWVMKDMPAVREEPFMTTRTDYIASIEGQIAQMRRRDGSVMNTSNTWERLWDQQLKSNTHFGDELRPSGDVRRLAASLTEGLATPREKLAALYEYVRDQIAWRGGRSIWAQDDMDDVLEAKQGNGGDKAILLIALARAADLDADPVLISTRDHGRMKPFYPYVRQFNHLLVAVDLGEDEPLLLDPTAANAPLGILDPLSLNGIGMLMPDREDPRWIPVTSDVAFRSMIDLSGTLRGDGAFVGTLTASDAGYSALVQRDAYSSLGTAERFVRETLLDGSSDAEISEARVENADLPDNALSTTAEVVLPWAAQVAGDYIYLFPVLLRRLEESPLRSPERTYPVDMTYKRDVIYTMRLQVPEGYTIDDTPVPTRVALEDGSGLMTRLIAEENGILTVQLRFRLAKSLFEPLQYSALREFYDRYISAMNDPIILVRGE